MPKHVRIFSTKSQLVEAVTEEIAAVLDSGIKARGLSNMALSGGNTPRDVYRKLAVAPDHERIDWERVYLFWGDERCVPPEHADSNFRMVKETLLNSTGLPGKNVFRMRGELSAAEAATEYAELIARHFKEDPPSFDLILLGMGGDGHTASLFPQTEVLHVRDRPVAAVYVPKLRTWRVTLTLPVLNAARAVLFLVSGKSKAEMIQRILALEEPAIDLPASLVRPQNGNVTWMLDADAASLMNK